MGYLARVLWITAINLSSIRSRKGAASVVVLGTAGVVVVLVALLGMAQGFKAGLAGTARDDRAIILRGGAATEMESWIGLDEAALVEDLPGIARVEGRPLKSRRTWVTATVAQDDGNEASVPVRGVEPGSLVIHDEMTIARGRPIAFGSFEVMVGSAAARTSEALGVGRLVPLRGVEWEVVGVFTTGGSAYDSELWVDNALLAGKLNRRDTVTSVLVALDDTSRSASAALRSLNAAIAADRRLSVEARSEKSFFAGQAEAVFSLIRGFGYGIAVVMAIGASLGAVNIMHGAVAARRGEIGALRTLGFRGGSVIVPALVIETLTLGLAGGGLGAGVAFAVFDGFAASTLGANYAQVGFEFDINLQVLAEGVAMAMALGVLGGLTPALTAARAPLTSVLRGR